MSDINSQKQKKQSAKGRKSMLIIGIILLNISIFMAAFVFSFNMIIEITYLCSVAYRYGNCP